MVLKPIELLVLQKGALERIKLAEIDLYDHDPELSYHFNPVAMNDKFWTGISEKYEVTKLLQNYVKGVRKLQQLVAELVQGTEHEDKASLETITQHPFVYASPAAYELVKPRLKKEKEDDVEINPVAHISWEEGIEHGIFVSLGDHYGSQHLLSSNIHEHGHYLHFILNSEHYNNCDSTLRETMAIFMEMKCGMSINYLAAEPGKETPHHRAQELLSLLESKKSYAPANVAS
ncbi:MAG: hypothetical protein Q8R47_01515 [Nanoarchaeota archaeon]|nr:hypothetical protein [Nanoarchaeota archaeon]